MEKSKRKQKTWDYDFSFIAPLPIEECITLAENNLIYERKRLGLKWRVFNQRNYVGKANEQEAYFELFISLGFLFHTVGYLKYRDFTSTFVYGTIETSATFQVYLQCGFFILATFVGIVMREIFILLWVCFAVIIFGKSTQQFIDRTKKELLGLITETFNKRM